MTDLPKAEFANSNTSMSSHDYESEGKERGVSKVVNDELKRHVIFHPDEQMAFSSKPPQRCPTKNYLKKKDIAIL